MLKFAIIFFYGTAATDEHAKVRHEHLYGTAAIAEHAKVRHEHHYGTAATAERTTWAGPGRPCSCTRSSRLSKKIRIRTIM